MATFPKTLAYSVVSALFFFTSCQKEAELDEILNYSQSGISVSPSNRDNKDLFQILISKEKVNTDYFFKTTLTASAEGIAPEPAECLPTAMLDVVLEHLSPIARDELARENLSFYQYINYIAAITDTSPQYFGARGEYTRHVQKVQRDLERFWGMQDRVRVIGQHNETLNDREKLADVLYYHLFQDLENREDVYPEVDEMLYKNSLSPNLPESPLFSGDGFSHKNGTIVVGDGLIQMISETGIEPTVSWTGILAHEWAHQIQNNDYLTKNIEFSAVPPFRELEADFFAGYYLTHKRGATYNWKKTEQFLELFFNLGDCSIENRTHHGTPQQRMEAARLGYELAMGYQKKGHILSALEVHEYFVNNAGPF